MYFTMRPKAGQESGDVRSSRRRCCLHLTLAFEPSEHVILVLRLQVRRDSRISFRLAGYCSATSHLFSRRRAHTQ